MYYMISDNYLYYNIVIMISSKMRNSSLTYKSTAPRFSQLNRPNSGIKSKRISIQP